MLPSNAVHSAHLPIGVTDSGAGGLSVLRELRQLLPNEQFVYLADDAMMPYGDRPVHEIRDRTLQIARFFYRMPCKALVIACNTATAAGALEVRQALPNWPVVAIEPAVKPAALLTRTGKVGILATTNTLASQRFQALVERFEDVAEVASVPCPGLVDLIETVPRPEAALREVLAPRVKGLVDSGVDVLVLGCTHYPFVTDVIADLAGPGVQVLDTGLPVARQLKTRLDQLSLLQAAAQPSAAVQFLTTGNVERLQSQVLALLGQSWAAYSVACAELPSN